LKFFNLSFFYIYRPRFEYRSPFREGLRLPHYSSGARFTPEIEAANAVIREITTRHGAAVIDLNSFIAAGGRLEPDMTVDGVHLSAKGINIWAGQIGRRLAAMNKP
jgi:lysophospholipase L1-like esterase